jgi:hypothetical protein
LDIRFIRPVEDDPDLDGRPEDASKPRATASPSLSPAAFHVLQSEAIDGLDV